MRWDSDFRSDVHSDEFKIQPTKVVFCQLWKLPFFYSPAFLKILRMIIILPNICGISRIHIYTNVYVYVYMAYYIHDLVSVILLVEHHPSPKTD